MKTRSWTIVAVLLVAILLVSACAAPAPAPQATPASAADATTAQPTAAPAASGEPVTLTYWIYSDYATGAALDMQKTFIAEFEAANPGIKIDLVGKPGTDISAGLIAGATSGELPDVFVHGLGDTPTYSTLGLLTDLTDRYNQMPDAWKNQFIPEVLQMAYSDGKLYGLPYTGYATMLYRNLKTLKDAGIDPAAGIKDRADWLEQMQKLSKNGVASIPALTVNWWLIESIYAGEQNSQTGFDDQGKSTLDAKKLADTLTFIVEAQKLGTELGAFDQGATDLFTSNKMGFFLGGPWMDLTFKEAAKSGLEYDKVLVPGVTADEKGGVRGYEYLGITNGKNIDTAWKWATFLTDVKQQARWSAALGRYVPNQAALDDAAVKSNELVQLTAKSAENAVFDYPPYFKPMPADWMSKINDILSAIGNGSMTAEAGAQTIIDSFNTMYNQK